ncbi:MAG: NAD(P)/FAD-dependent oxidoreductase [Fidelibacterota bacterium]|nr:MAG: NAD(P)/FAD-dependent oxidoreductase [Candidatus Neomarinimicrobiota bacterium]
MTYDLIIVGSGPSGAAAAMFARRYSLRTLLLDKAAFPRDKICGDALSGKSVAILRELNLLDGVRRLPGATISRIIFTSPRHTELAIDLKRSSLNQVPEGFVIRRRNFDRFLFEEARRAADTCLESFTVTDLVYEDGFVCGVRGRQGDNAEIEHRGRIVLGADGYNSLVARKTDLYHHDPRHWVVALRQYYHNVSGLSDQIELHYVDEVIPGYFWIFPLENGCANVGIGMLHQYIKDQKVDLRQALKAAIDSPAFRERFTGAESLEEPVGWNLPVGSKHRRIVGNGFMLLGDAAGLIDPFTGEGIGNALYSARFAVGTAREAIKAEDVSETFLARYDKRLWDAIGGELRVSTQLQKIGRYRLLLNFVISKAARNGQVSDLIAGMIANEVPRKQLANPLFYLKLLFS